MTNREFLSKLTNEEISHYFETMFCGMYDCEHCPLNDSRLFGMDCGRKEIADWLGKEHKEGDEYVG